MLLGLVIVGILTLAVVVMRSKVAELFLVQMAGNGNATTEIAGKLLLVGAIFFIADAVAMIATGALRGLKDTKVPLLFAGISYWVVY
ncbi:Na+-driven multidrug efflux pump [Bradyrhizobium japonicum]